MKKWVWQIVGWILNLMLLGWVRLKELVDWLGRGIAIHDTQEKGMIWMSGLVNWLTATPPWIPGMLAAVLTLALLANLLRPLRTKKEVAEQKPTSPTDNFQTTTERLTNPKQLIDYFQADFSNCIKFTSAVFAPLDGNKNKLNVSWQVCSDFSTGSQFIMFYVPDRKDAYETCVALADFPDLAISHTKSAVAIQSKAPGDASHIDMSALTFSGRVYLYHLDWMSLTQLGSLEELYRKKNYSIVFRGPNYSADKIAHEKADALNKHG